MWSAIAGAHGDRGSPFAPQSFLSWVLTEAGVTPAVHLRGPAPLAASPTQSVRESGEVLAELGESRDVGRRHPCP